MRFEPAMTRTDRTPYVPQEVWEQLDHDGRSAYLRLEADQAWIRDEVVRAKAAATRGVNRRWMALTRNVTKDEIAVFNRERELAREEAVGQFWEAVAFRDGRCAHAASPDGCRVLGCTHLWRPPPVPADRYFTGALRLQILQRDNYTCQYCGKKVRDELGPDHRDKANIDHVIPYPTGPTSIENGKTSCTVCNALKGASDSFHLPTPVEDL